MTPLVQLTLLVLTVVFFVPGSIRGELECSAFSPHFDTFKYMQKNHCFRSSTYKNEFMLTDSLNCKENPRGIEFILQNSETGELDMVFQHLHNVTKYEFTLEFLNKTEDECARTLETETGSVHSLRDYYVEESTDAIELDPSLSCEMKGVSSFKYVFSGCYRLKIKSDINEFIGCPRFLHTKYVKSFITESPKFHIDYICTADHTTNLRLTFQFDNLIGPHELSMKLSYDVDLRLGNEACQRTGREKTCCAYLPHEPVICRDQDVNHTTKCRFYDDQKVIICIVPNVPPGNYCIKGDYTLDDRCQPNTLWGTGNSTCIGVKEFNLTEINCPVNSEEIASSPNVTLPIVLCAIIVVLLCCLAWFIKAAFCKRPPGSPGQVLEISSDEENPMELWEKPQVFLLYARDCILFMRLMSTFRNYLRNSGFQVYDCFQDDCFEKVSVDPAQWVRNLVNRSRVKVIVVSTECGFLRQLAHLQSRKLVYTDPKCFDDVFLYGLKSIVDYKSSDMYKRHYLVRLNGFTDDDHLLTHITPHRVYTLPNHMEELLGDLRGLSSIKKEEINGYSHQEKSKFREDLTNLVNFKMKNRNYLEQFLEIR